MRVDWRGDKNAPRCYVVDQDTGWLFSPLAMADEETGEFERYAYENGKFVIDQATKRVATVKGRANLKIVPLMPGEPHPLSQRRTV